MKEHQKDTELITNRKYTRANRKESTTEFHKSTITDHITQENHVINWEGAKILDRNANSFTRKICESIHIRKRGAKFINRDKGAISLDHVYNPLLKMTSSPSPRNNNKFPGKCSGPDHL